LLVARSRAIAAKRLQWFADQWDCSIVSDNSKPSSRANPFWDFSLRLYASPAVQKACIELQDGAGVDVNVMLFVLYMASRGRTLTAGDVRGVLAAVEPWRVDVVVPLRTARRNLKVPAGAIDREGAESLRSIVKKAELEAERLQQAALFGMSDGLGDPAQPEHAGEVNLRAYGAALGRQLAQGPSGVMLAAFREVARPRE
jgi:uncharacterized protein (TIGR02444 family)